jgi:hypothetical protein
MTGEEIDEVIAEAVAAKAADLERKRRSDWAGQLVTQIDQ